MTDSAGEAVESWVFDGARRIRRFDEDNYFFGRSESYRYDRQGRLTHVDLLSYEGGGAGDFEPRGPEPVRTSLESGQVVEERPNLSWIRAPPAGATRRGSPSSWDVRSGAGGCS